MKKLLLTVAGMALAATFAAAGGKPSAGTIISESSVDCGTQKKNKKVSVPLLCQQYVVRTANVEYQIRQQKPSDQALIPATTPIQFTLDKSKMKFKANGKKYEFLVVGQSALTAPPH